MSALTKAQLKTNIKNALNNSSREVRNPTEAQEALDEIAEQISNAVDRYVQQEIERVITALKTPAAFGNGAGPCVPGVSITTL